MLPYPPRTLALLLSLALLLIACQPKLQQTKHTLLPKTHPFPPDTPLPFVHAERAFAKYDLFQLQREYQSTHAYTTDLKNKARLYQNTARLYKTLYENRKDKWSMAALTRAADLEMHFAYVFYNTPNINFEETATQHLKRALLKKGVPPRLHNVLIPKLLTKILPNIQRNFRIAQIKRGNIFAKRGLLFYKQCLSFAQTHKLENLWSKRARIQLKHIQYRKLQPTPPKQQDSPKYRQLPLPWLKKKQTIPPPAG